MESPNEVAPPRLILGRPRGAYTVLWKLLALGIAGTTGQYLCILSGPTIELLNHYGWDRFRSEHLQATVVSKHVLQVSNGETIANQTFGAFLVGLFIFIASSTLLYYLIALLLPSVDRRALLSTSFTRDDEDVKFFFVGIALILTMFFWPSPYPRIFAGTILLGGAWLVEITGRRSLGN